MLVEKSMLLYKAANAIYRPIAILHRHCVFRMCLVFTEEVLQLKADV